MAEVTVAAVDQGAGVGAISSFQTGRLFVPNNRRTGENQTTQDGAKATIRAYGVPVAPGANRFEAVASGTNNIEGEHATTELDRLRAHLPRRRPRRTADAAHPDRRRWNKAIAGSRLNLDYGVADADAVSNT